MEVLWFIGNGFDLNLGLDTSYSGFYKRVYSVDKEAAPQRERLQSIIQNGSDLDIEYWSDFEELLGWSSGDYSVEEADLFHYTFEEIEQLFIEYLKGERARFDSKTITDQDRDEFWDSITHFWKRFTPVDINRIKGLMNPQESIIYRYVSLNYTDCFDEYLKCAKTAHDPFDSRVVTVTYNDSSNDVLHIHGELYGDEEIVFGVSDASQLANEQFAEDEDCCELWIKERKNGFFGNLKVDNLKDVIRSANVICAYGTNFGQTDRYIWQKVGDRLRASSSVKMVLFSHGLPARNSPRARQFQIARKEAISRFAIASGMANEEMKSIETQIIVIPSNIIFHMSPDLAV